MNETSHNSFSGAIDIYDGHSLSYCFSTLARGVFLSFTVEQSKVDFQVGVADPNNSPGSVGLPLPETHRSAYVARIIFEKAYACRQINRRGSKPVGIENWDRFATGSRERSFFNIDVAYEGEVKSIRAKKTRMP